MLDQSVSYPKRLSKSQKNLIVAEHFQSGISISELARKNQVNPAILYNWKVRMKKNTESESKDVREILDEVEKLRQENSKLKKALGEATLDITLQKDIIEFLKKKDLEARLKKQKNISRKLKKRLKR
jgi:transposase-like protein